MKHTVKVTLLLLSIFIIAQLFGLLALSIDLEVVKDDTGKVVSYNYSNTAIGQRPEGSPGMMVVLILSAVLFGTLLLLLLIKFKQIKIWKTWFFLAVFLTISVSLEIFMNPLGAYLIAFFLAIYKVLRHNFFVQNITEVLMYAGIAVLFVPILNVFWMIILLIIISAYDAYAVWKSKHMVKMANFQTEAKLFAGLTIPYKKHEKTKKSTIKIKIPKAKDYTSETKGERVAILGGGDIAFPLIFSGTVMQSLIVNQGILKLPAFFLTQIITITGTLALAYLFVKGEKNKFYPAMPFLTAGLLIGYGILSLILLI